jgi:hypothetical protein
MAHVLVWIATVIAIAIVVLVVAGVLLPIRFRFGLSRDPKWRLTVHIAPLNGHAPFIGVVDSLEADTGSEAHEAVPQPESRRRRRRRRRLPSRRLLASLSNFVADLISAIRVERAQGEITFGLGDPAETGQVFGLLAPLVYGVGHQAPGRFVIRPDFENQVLCGSAMLEVSLVPARLLPSGVGVARAFLRDRRR